MELGIGKVRDNKQWKVPKRELGIKKMPVISSYVKTLGVQRCRR